jgi:hypothetical protein
MRSTSPYTRNTIIQLISYNGASHSLKITVTSSMFTDFVYQGETTKKAKPQNGVIMDRKTIWNPSSNRIGYTPNVPIFVYIPSYAFSWTSFVILWDLFVDIVHKPRYRCINKSKACWMKLSASISWKKLMCECNGYTHINLIFVYVPGCGCRTLEIVFQWA